MRLRRAAAWSAAWAALTLGFLLVSDRRIGIYDEGCILQGAALMLTGAVPHRDFYTNYGPGQFAVVAALFKLFGTTALIGRVWDAAARAAAVALLFAGAKPLAGGRLAAVLGAIAFAFLAALPNVYGYPVFPALAAVLGAALLLRADGTPLRQMGAGLCLGAATLFRLDIGVACLAAGLIAVAGAAWLARRRGDVAGMARVAAGWLAVVVPMMLWLAAVGALPALWFDVVAFPARNYARMRSLAFPGLREIAADPGLICVLVPPALCALALPAIWRAARRDAVAAAGAIAPLLFTLVLYAKGWVRISPVHVAAGFTMALLLLAQLARLAGRQLGWAAMPVLLACVAGSLGVAGRRLAGNLAWLAHDAWVRPGDLAAGFDTCRPPPGFGRSACMVVPGARAQAIAFVQAHTRPDAAIFVGLPRHDRILANDVAFAFQAARRPATAWYDFNPGLQTSLPVQEAIIGDLRREDPPVAVIEDAFQTWREPNDSGVSSGVFALDAAIAARFRPGGVFGPYAVLVKR